MGISVSESNALKEQLHSGRSKKNKQLSQIRSELAQTIPDGNRTNNDK